MQEEGNESTLSSVEFMCFLISHQFCVIKNTEETMIPCNTLDIIRFCIVQRVIVLSNDKLQE